MKEPTDCTTRRVVVQQSICTTKDKWKATKPAPSVIVEQMKNSRVISKEEKASSGFRESLRFFQKQEAGGNAIPSKCQRVITAEYSDEPYIENKGNTPKSYNTVPTVDNILSNVRTICAKQNSKSNAPIQTKPVIHVQRNNRFMNGITSCENEKISRISNHKNSTLSGRFNPSFDIENNIEVNPALKNIHHSHVGAKDYNVVYNGNKSAQTLSWRKNMHNTSCVHNLSNSSENGKDSASRISKSPLNGESAQMNIINGQNELLEIMEKIAAKRKKAEMERSQSKFCPSAFIDSDDCVSLKSELSIDNTPTNCFMPIRPQPIYTSTRKKAAAEGPSKLAEVSISCKHDKVSPKTHPERTRDFQTSSENHACNGDNNSSTPTFNNSSKSAVKECNIFLKPSDNGIIKLTDTVKALNLTPREDIPANEVTHTQLIKENGCLDEKLTSKSDMICERGYDSLESDYQPQDFVVHKTTLAEDYLDITSEDAYSSINDDYEVEHPDDTDNCPNTPSPDYVSDEDEEFLIHQGLSEYQEGDTNNTGDIVKLHYVPDPRRYYYYPDEKELEVIPEEDEDELDEEDCYSQECSDQGSPDLSLSRNKVITKENVIAEWDSGVPDDHSSMDDFSIDVEEVVAILCGEQQDSETEDELPLTPSQLASKDYYQKNITTNWDPSRKLIPTLYSMPFDPFICSLNDGANCYPSKGYVPMTVVEANSLKKVVRILDLSNENCRSVYIRVEAGKMYFQKNEKEEAICFILLAGSVCRMYDKFVMRINDKKGNIFVLHFNECPLSDLIMESIIYNSKLTLEQLYCYPNFRPITTFFNTVIIDIGGQSIRAGVAMSDVTLPILFFPSTILNDPQSKQYHFGNDVFKPHLYNNCDVEQPYSASFGKQMQWNINILRNLLKYIFSELRIEPNRFKMVLTTSRRLTNMLKMQTANLILREFNMMSLCVSLQSCSTMAGYKAETGLCIELGDKTSISPFYCGKLIPMADSVVNFGTPAILEFIIGCLREINDNASLTTPFCHFLLRYVLEKLCYVAENYDSEVEKSMYYSEQIYSFAPISEFFSDADEECIRLYMSKGRFSTVEALFRPSVWGLDIPPLFQRVLKVINAVPEDCRSEICSHIFLAGGLTICKNFIDRVMIEIEKTHYLRSINPTVHSSDYRSHMSYFGSYEIATNAKYKKHHITLKVIERLSYAAFDAWTNSS